MDKKYISDNKRVILITGDESKWFEQAIFIVKKHSAASKTPTDFIREAESIIRNYMSGAAERTPRTDDVISESKTRGRTDNCTKKKQKSGLDVVINVLIIAACTALVVMISKGIMG